jgi:hypothetical protein
MMNNGHTRWQGGLKDGSGSFRAGSLAGKYSPDSKAEQAAPPSSSSALRTPAEWRTVHIPRL